VKGRKNPYKGADHFTVEAKKAGYPARSVFKLEEIDKRVRMFRPGQSVLDLGASPGSWTLYAAGRVGPKGRVLAMDLKELNTQVPANVEFFIGDALSLETEALSRFAPYDVVVSDMAPNTTGNRLGDQTRSFDLFMRALAVAEALLKPGGAFVGKIFMGEDFVRARDEVKRLFAAERTIRPEGTRTSSYEVFVVGERRKAPEHASPNATQEPAAPGGRS
jgi:23S rRNA (uridine2552-2'-O)-methyltransferase